MKLITSILTFGTLNVLMANPYAQGDCVIPPKSKEYDPYNGNPTLEESGNPDYYDPGRFAGGLDLGFQNRNEPYRGTGSGSNPGGGIPAMLAVIQGGGSGSNAYTFSKRDLVYQEQYKADVCALGRGYANLNLTGAAAGSNLYGGGMGSSFLGGGMGSSFLGGAMGSLFTGGGSGSNFNGGGSSNKLSASPQSYTAAGAHSNDKADGSGRNPHGTKGFTPTGAQIACVKPESATTAASKRLEAANKAKRLRYYGGAIMSEVRVFPIYWGEKYNHITDNMDIYYRTILDSTWFNILSQYTTSNADCGRIKPGIIVGSYNQTTNLTRVGIKNEPVIDDSEVQSQLLKLMEVNAIPYPDRNTYYPVHLALGINFTINAVNATGCRLICAYHSNFFDEVWNQNIFYSVMIDSGTCLPGQCGQKTLNRNQNNQMTASHELMESITDPFVGYGWFDYSSFMEIGDLCNQEATKILGVNGAVFYATKVFSNANVNKGCTDQCPTFSIAATTPTQYYQFCYPPYNPSFEIEGTSGFAYGDQACVIIGSTCNIKGWTRFPVDRNVYRNTVWAQSGSVSVLLGSSFETSTGGFCNITSDYIRVIPGLTYNLTFYSKAGFNYPSNLIISTITNATWFDNVNLTSGFNLITDEIAVVPAVFDDAQSKKLKRSVLFTAYDYLIAVRFSALFKRSIFIDTIELQPALPPLCDADEKPIYSVSTGSANPTIYYHFCSNPSNPANPSFEKLVGTTQAQDWTLTQLSTYTAEVLGGITTSFVQSGAKGYRLGHASTSSSTGRWARITSNLISVTPGATYSITFFALSSSTTAAAQLLNLYVTEDNTSNIILDTQVKVGSVAATAKQVSFLRTFEAPASGNIKVIFETKNAYRFYLDTVQVTKNSKDDVILHDSSAYVNDGSTLAVPDDFTPDVYVPEV